MGVFIRYMAFNADGALINTGQSFCPESLDYAPIEEKELYFKYMGGLPVETAYCYIESQGGRKLITNVDAAMVEPVDAAIHRRKLENVESYIAEECRRLGIERTRERGNQ